jgi:hypothetical protein
LYDWAFIRLDPAPGEQHGQRWLLLRRHQRTGELAFYRCFMPRRVPLAVLVHVAGCRWRSWYRWTTLAMLAPAFLVVAAVTERARHPPAAGLTNLTCNEVQHPFAALLVQPAGDGGQRLRWSLWRRRHQHRARACHYRPQATQS